MPGTLFVPITLGVADDSIPTGPQISAKYTLIGPDGTRVVFNDIDDRDYVGMFTDITGLDSPEIRESAEDLVQMDGGIHGDFYLGRRPMTFSGMLLNPVSIDDRNRRMTKLQRASMALRGDGTLTWELAGGYTQFVKFRRQQPLRITGAWQKEVQLALVASDPRIYGYELKNKTILGPAAIGGGHLYAQNRGNTLMYPQITIQGPVTNPILYNRSGGGQIKLTITLTSGQSLTVDTLTRTVVDSSGISRYSAVDFLNTSWWGLNPGTNDLQFSASAAPSGSAFRVYWRDAWV